MSPFAWPNGAAAAVSFSFDDGRESQLDVGIPIFDALGVRATFYVLPRLAGPRAPEWRNAAAQGHEMGNHTTMHPCAENFPFARERALERLSVEEIRRDCEDADLWIEESLGVRPKSFAYPCGQSYVGAGAQTRSYVPVIADRYLAARCFAEGAVIDPEYCNLHQLPAFDIDSKPLTAVLTFVEQAVAAGGWVIFAGHEIGDGTARQTTGAFVIGEIVKRINSSPKPVWVDTVAAIAEYVARRRSPREEA